MEQLALELVKKHWLIAAFVIAISLISGLIKILRAVIDTHEDLYLKRDLKRLTELKASVSVGSQVAKFIDKRIEEEAFALASGIRTAKEDADMLRDLYLKDFLTNRQLKRIAQHLKPENDKIAIQFGWFEKTEVIYSFWASIVLLMIGFSGLLPLIAQPSITHVLFAVATFGAALLMIAFVGADFQRYKTLYFAWSRLRSENLLANPNCKIKVPGVYTPSYLHDLKKDEVSKESTT
ncbi:hypothetical protein [Rheinheimera sp.]|uniref:hypothetical protein n=1 Tax=Rheinheimera sp. TaxID=1869214 RepID=UPI00235641E7|nr:hypothetical protein [Rheinheimera sp.]